MCFVYAFQDKSKGKVQQKQPAKNGSVTLPKNDESTDSSDEESSDSDEENVSIIDSRYFIVVLNFSQLFMKMWAISLQTKKAPAKITKTATKKDESSDESEESDSDSDEVCMLIILFLRTEDKGFLSSPALTVSSLHTG